jgi:hypothetical protein
MLYSDFFVNAAFPSLSIFDALARRTSLNVRFSQILNDDATFQANLVGFSVSLVYITIYYRYVAPEDKLSHLMKIFGTAGFIVLVIVYSKVGRIDLRNHFRSPKHMCRQRF